jgi:hypothetical protein
MYLTYGGSKKENCDTTVVQKDGFELKSLNQNLEE